MQYARKTEEAILPYARARFLEHITKGKQKHEDDVVRTLRFLIDEGFIDRGKLGR